MIMKKDYVDYWPLEVKIGNIVHVSFKHFIWEQRILN